MPKKMKFERDLARKARAGAQITGPGDFGALPPESIPHEATTDPPGGDVTAQMAAGGQDVVRGNSNQQHLTAKGMASVAKTGADLAKLGGVDQIIGSDAQRTQDTAQALQATDPKHPPVKTDPNLESHAMGNLEGEPRTPGVRKFIADLVRKAPDYRIPGQGALTSKPGESFNEFRVRALSAVRGVMQTLAQNPVQAIAVPKHSQVSRLVMAWVAAGLPDDLSVDPKVMASEDYSPKPGEIEKFAPDAEGNWQITPFDPEKESSLPKGAIYFVEHGETPSTAAKSGQVSAGQRARAQILSAVRAGDWKGAQKAAKSASGLLSDDEISQAIDEALPSGDEAAQLEPHQVLPMASAAGPAKRAELLPVVQQKFGEMPGVSPDGVQMLRSHIGRLSTPAR